MFEIIDLFSPSEFEFLRDLITLHFKKKVGTLENLSTYHEIASDEIHRSLASKKERVLEEEDTGQLFTLSAIQNLLYGHPGYQVSNVVYDSDTQENRPEFYLRLVRPYRKSDIGTPHCDFWFDEAMRTNFGRGNTIKFWIPIVIDPGKNGLLFYPCKADTIPYLIINDNGFRRPIINCETSELGDPILPQPNYGQAIKFCDDIVHCGALNVGSTTRVSIEITLVKSK